MNSMKFVFFFVLTILFQDTSYAQEWFSHQSQQQINDLVDTGDELIMATDAGLVVMNKSTLEKTFFNKANSNLRDNHIQTITEASNGDIWIGTYDVSFARFTGTDFEEAIDLEGDFNPNTLELYDLKVAPNGDFWVATSQAIFHKQGQDWTQYGKEELDANLFEIWDLAINAEGEVFAASSMVYKFADGEWTNIMEGTELFGYLGADLFFSTSGDLYFAGALDKIGRFDGEVWHENDFSIDINGSETVHFTEDLDGNVYINTRRDGIFKLVDDTWEQQSNQQVEEFDNHTSYFYIDERGNQWLNDNIHLTVNESGNIRSTTISQHTIGFNNIYGMHKGENGFMYFLTPSDEYISVVAPNGDWSFLILPTLTMPFEYLQDILVFAENDIWLSSTNGLYHFNGNEWTFTDLEPCGSFAVDSKGKIYVRSSSLIYIIENEVISEYNVDNSPLSAEYIAGHGVDPDDNLWIAEWEINVIQKVSTDGTWTAYSHDDYPSLEKPTGDFHFDVNGNVWIPHDVVGALKFDGTTWSNPYGGGVIDQVSNYSVNDIESDATGKVYFAHQYGVTTLFDGELGELLIEDVPNQFSSSTSNIEFDDEGTLWWSNNRYGVFSYSTGNPTSIHSGFSLNFDFSTYPNPAVDYTILDFTLEERADVKAFVYNSLGQIQLSLDLGQLSAGAFQERMDVSNLSTGFYTLQLWVNDRFSTKGMIVQ